MHYQLFIPETADGNPLGTPPQALERLGLADLVAGHEGIPKTGPEDLRGLLYCWRKTAAPNSFSYTPEKQTWLPAVPGKSGEAKGRYWVGFWNDDPVKPEDLQRSHAELGDAVQLGDGNSWMVPCVQNFARDLIRDDDGSWKFDIQRKHQASWNDAQKWLTILRDNAEFSYADLADFVESYLRLNYRLLTEVSSHLRLFSTANLMESLSAILSMQATLFEGGGE